MHRFRMVDHRGRIQLGSDLAHKRVSIQSIGDFDFLIAPVTSGEPKGIVRRVDSGGRLPLDRAFHQQIFDVVEATDGKICLTMMLVRPANESPELGFASLGAAQRALSKYAKESKNNGQATNN